MFNVDLKEFLVPILPSMGREKKLEALRQLVLDAEQLVYVTKNPNEPESLRGYLEELHVIGGEIYKGIQMINEILASIKTKQAVQHGIDIVAWKINCKLHKDENRKLVPSDMSMMLDLSRMDFETQRYSLLNIHKDVNLIIATSGEREPVNNIDMIPIFESENTLTA